MSFSVNPNYFFLFVVDFLFFIQIEEGDAGLYKACLKARINYSEINRNPRKIPQFDETFVNNCFKFLL